jgi:hypothetical protein
MANNADNFAYMRKTFWEKRSVNAVEYAKRRGAEIVQAVNVPDHWINEPGDEPGYLMEWPDGSRYIVGQNGHWVAAQYGAGQKTPRYIPIE